MMKARDLKKHLIEAISERVLGLEMSQYDMAEALNIGQSDVSKLIHKRDKSFSLERLLSIAVSLGYEINIQVIEKEKT